MPEQKELFRPVNMYTVYYKSGDASSILLMFSHW